MTNAFASRPLSADLQTALERVLGRPASSLGRRPFPYQTSFALEEITVTFADGDVHTLLFKNLSRRSLDPRASESKPDFVYEPVREIDVYRSLLTEDRLGTAVCYGAVADPDRERYWLFLERVRGVELWQLGELAAWEDAARWLARFHQSGHAAPPSLLVHDAQSYRRWLERAASFHGRKALAPVAARHEQVLERLARLPATVIHGEYYPSNVLVRANGSPSRICPVDWEMAAVGPGLIDLAALTFGWEEDAARRIAHAYRETLARPPVEDELLLDLDCCRLQLAVQWLGWSAHWAPPAEHAHDWLAEAHSLAERLL